MLQEGIRRRGDGAGLCMTGAILYRARTRQCEVFLRKISVGRQLAQKTKTGAGGGLVGAGRFETPDPLRPSYKGKFINIAHG